MKESFTLSESFPVSSEIIYKAWLSSQEHSEMTGGSAEVSSIEGDEFWTWDEYITGKNLELVPFKKIRQSWRTTEFADRDEDSELLIELVDNEGTTKLILAHSNIPEGQTQYKQGWIDHYFEPMKSYFSQ